METRANRADASKEPGSVPGASGHSTSPTTDSSTDLAARASRLRDLVEAWLDRHSWRGHDPFDGLVSPLAASLLKPRLRDNPLASFARLAVLQGVKRMRIDPRRLLGIPAQENAMSWGVGAHAASIAFRRGDGGAFRRGSGGAYRRGAGGAERIRSRVESLLALRHAPTGLWGYPFPWQARAFFVPAGEPNLVVSCVALRGLFEACWALPEESAPWRAAFSRAVGSLLDLFWRQDPGYFSYVAHDSVLVHNANLFGAEAIHQGAAIGVEGCEPTLSLAARAIQASLAAQAPNGRWAYGSLAIHSWSDCFHTAYNLVSLARIASCLRGGAAAVAASRAETGGLAALEKAIEQGWRYYVDHSFTPEGACRYYDQEEWPHETHSVAAALIACAELAERGFLPRADARDLASRILRQAESELHAGDGEFLYRRWPRSAVRGDFTRWTQAWMLLALESALGLAAASVRP